MSLAFASSAGALRLHVPLAVAVVLLIAGCSGGGSPSDSTEPGRSETGSPTVAGSPTHPRIRALQIPDERPDFPDYSTIYDLMNFDGRLLIAHGDWANNSGPTNAVSYNSSSDSFVNEGAVFLDEAIVKFRQTDDGGVVAPGIDATQEWSFGNFYHRKPGGSWQMYRTIPEAIHVWDVLPTAKTWLAVGVRLGSDSHVHGAAWASSDGGLSWSFLGEDYDKAIGHNQTDQPLHVWASLGTIGGNVFAFFPLGRCAQLKSEGWIGFSCFPSSTSYLAGGFNFEGNIVLTPGFPIAHSTAAETDRNLYLWDGTRGTTIAFPSPVRDAAVQNGELFVLTGRDGVGTIWRTEALSCRCLSDFRSIVRFEVASGRPTAIEVQGEKLYVGMADGRLFEVIAGSSDEVAVLPKP